MTINHISTSKAGYVANYAADPTGTGDERYLMSISPTRLLVHVKEGSAATDGGRFTIHRGGVAEPPMVQGETISPDDAANILGLPSDGKATLIAAMRDTLLRAGVDRMEYDDYPSPRWNRKVSYTGSSGEMGCLGVYGLGFGQEKSDTDDVGVYTGYAPPNVTADVFHDDVSYHEMPGLIVDAYTKSSEDLVTLLAGDPSPANT